MSEREKLGEQMDFWVTMSCFEIYIETVKDLLDAKYTQSMATNLSKWTPVSVVVTSPDDV